MYLLGILLFIIGGSIITKYISSALKLPKFSNVFKLKKRDNFSTLNKEFLKESRDKILILKSQRKQIKSWKYKTSLNNCISKCNKISEVFVNQPEKIRAFRIEYRNLINLIIDINARYIDVESNNINDQRIKSKLKEASDTIKTMVRKIDSLGYKICESDIEMLDVEIDFAKNRINDG